LKRFQWLIFSKKFLNLVMLVKKKPDLLDIVQKILNLDSQMRFVAIIDTKGKIREAIMKAGKKQVSSPKKKKNTSVNKLHKEEL